MEGRAMIAAAEPRADARTTRLLVVDPRTAAMPTGASAT
jgi:hypothetical protein